MNEEMQTVILTLSDGTQAYFTGKKQINEGNISVVNVKIVTSPLAEGCKFTRLSELQANKQPKEVV